MGLYSAERSNIDTVRTRATTGFDLAAEALRRWLRDPTPQPVQRPRLRIAAGETPADARGTRRLKIGRSARDGRPRCPPRDLLIEDVGEVAFAHGQR
jgi:hypothetical protein